MKDRHVVLAESLDPAEAAQWHEALRYYDAHFTTHNLFDRFIGATPALLALGPSDTPPRTTTNLDEQWRSRLIVAAPIYRARFWPEHERRDWAYIEGMRPLIAAHGAWFATRLVAVFGMPLPTAPHRTNRRRDYARAPFRWFHPRGAATRNTQLLTTLHLRAVRFLSS